MTTPRAIALLEAKFWLDAWSRRAIDEVLATVNKAGFELRDSFVLDEHWQFPSEAVSAGDVLQGPAWSRYKVLGWNVVGDLAGHESVVSLTMLTEVPRLELSVSEAPLLAGRREPALDFLRALMALCRVALSSLPTPRWACIGTEGEGPLDDDDLESVAASLPPFRAAEFFSEAAVERLYRWYADVYAVRWQR